MDKKLLLGKRLKELRIKKGIKQEKLAELVGMEPTSVSNIETGKNYPSFQNLEKIINVLETNFIEVFQFEHQQETSDLLAEINNMLTKNPEKVQETYKIVKALVN